MTFDPPLHALWSDPSACPQAGNRVWCWPTGGAVSGPPTVGSPAHKERQQIWLQIFQGTVSGVKLKKKKKPRLDGGLEVKRDSWSSFNTTVGFYVCFILFTQEEFGWVHRLRDVTWSPFIVCKPDSNTGGFTVSPPKPFKYVQILNKQT